MIISAFLCVALALPPNHVRTWKELRAFLQSKAPEYEFILSSEHSDLKKSWEFTPFTWMGFRIFAKKVKMPMIAFGPELGKLIKAMPCTDTKEDKS